MSVFLAEHAGFCAGVLSALRMTLEQVGRDTKVTTLGALVHNADVQEYLKEQGVAIVEELKDLTNGVVIIRTHGLPPDLLKELQERKDLQIVDATCPRVRKVQKLVYSYAQKGYDIIIYGELKHPEVQALLGWSGGKACVLEPGETIEGKKLFTSSRAVFLAQTTQRKQEFLKIAEKLRESCPGLKIIPTVCKATEMRQKAAAALATTVDLMLVVGDTRSSNTRKLAQVCREITTTYQISGPSEIKREWLVGVRNVGITAGASTPHWTIKEVKQMMEEMEKMDREKLEEIVQEEETSSEEVIQDQFNEFRAGDIVTGKVVLVDNDQVLIDIGYKMEATLPRNEVFLEGNNTLTEQFSVGDHVDVLILKVLEEDDKIIVSSKRLQRERRWKELEEALNQGKVMQGVVKNIVPRGIIIDLGSGVEGFMPGSLVDIRYIPDFEQFRGATFSFKILELNRERDKVILSRKQFLEEEMEQKKQETIDRIKEGDIINGIVKRLTDFGAFVDVGNIDGLVHISEVSWQRVVHPRDVLKVGEEVPVKVLEVIPEKERISLSIRQAQPDPWTVASQEFTKGDIVKGRVTRIVNFGAFVELLPGVEGLVHISQMADFHVKHPSEIVREGEEVEVKIIDTNASAKRISLSIKDARPAPRDFSVPTNLKEENQGVTLGDVFGDLFNNNKDKHDA